MDNQPVWDDSDDERDTGNGDTEGVDAETQKLIDLMIISVHKSVIRPTPDTDLMEEDVDQASVVHESEDFESDGSDSGDDDVETDPRVLLTAKSKHSRIQRLINLLPKVFPEDQPEEYMLHQDLSFSNMLVDADHNLSGIIDWECVHTVPQPYAYCHAVERL